MGDQATSSYDDSIPIVLYHGGIWKENKYKKYKSEGILLSTNINYDGLVSILHTQLKLNPESHKVKIKYQALKGKKPFNIKDDMSLKFYLRMLKQSVDIFDLPMCVNTKINEGMELLENEAETASSTVSTSAPATSIFSFGMATNGSNLNQLVAAFANLFPSSSPVASSSSYANVVASSSSNTAPVSTSANVNSSSSFSPLSQAPTTESETGFKVGSSAVLFTSTKSETTGVELAENKAKETSFENSVKVPFGSSLSTTGGSLFCGATSAAVSSGSGIFNGTSSCTPITAGSLFGGTSQNTLAAPARVEYNGGSFSLGSSGGGDKSNRRIVRLKRNQRKK